VTPGRPACGSVAEGDVGGECVRERERGGGDERATAPASVGSGATVGGGGRHRSTAEGDGSWAVFGRVMRRGHGLGVGRGVEEVGDVDADRGESDGQNREQRSAARGSGAWADSGTQ